MKKTKPEFQPGDRVYLQHAKKDDPNADLVMTGREYGVVIHTWWEPDPAPYEEYGHWRCYVAFIGKKGFPKDNTKKWSKPYVLQYAEMFFKKYSRR